MEHFRVFRVFRGFTVLSPFYFGDVFESSAFCAGLSVAALKAFGVRRGFGLPTRNERQPLGHGSPETGVQCDDGRKGRALPAGHGEDL